MPHQQKYGFSRQVIILGIVTIVIVAFLTYFPALRVSFFDDDWMYLEKLGRLGPGEFVLRSLNIVDPAFLNTYRPVQGVLYAIEYSLFGKDPLGYRLVDTLFHIINCLLLCGTVRAMSNSLRLAFLSSLVYASLPIYSEAVFLVSAADMYATIFFVSTVWLWLIYLREKRAFILTHITLALGLLSKESVITLPLVLFLVDRLLVRYPIRIVNLFQRYVWMGLTLTGYVLLEIYILPRTVHSFDYRLSFGPHIFTNMFGYLSKLVFPWNLNIHSLAITAFLFLLAVAWRTQSRFLPFMFGWAMLNLLPIVGFANKFAFRYLYLPGVSSAAVLAWLLNRASIIWRFGQTRAGTFLASGLVSMLIFVSSNGVSLSAQEHAQAAFQERALFRSVAQKNRLFPADTYLYFMGVHNVFFPHFSGMFYWRYGDLVTVDLWKWNKIPQFSKHTNSIIYYINSEEKPIEVPMEESGLTVRVPETTANWGFARLESFQISSALDRAGKDLALFLYWRVNERINKDYTIFVHLVDADGNLIVSCDSQPGMGSMPTTAWSPGSLVTDWRIISIPPEVQIPLKVYFQVGLYYLPTMERLPIIDSEGNALADRIILIPSGSP